MNNIIDSECTIPICIQIADAQNVNVLDMLSIMAAGTDMVECAYMDFQRLYELDQGDSRFVI